ncbi:hypothetical protein ANME2D_01780 [Candidatus Methanoperedens nitroreducens]|uniref:Right handed beta helix domain-containing protein n=1 Tax=Candidatus Methanoperedens nitratireducens TaxID=1392998 RepID=A0A062UXL5_9EURY|nr:hypothetical protein [Candidatus Methanoperedens nitroreducens]KCZ71726.1 hypothetical protein ANME2D_01780 [Candidatus Methanoperedens nitroreducens]MDJ1422301.1 hypothetical protein [Candidatus Methanoperedens sp.]
MYIKFVFIFFVLLLTYTTPSLAAPIHFSNLIANPGFESGTTKPLNWSFVTVDGNTPLWSTVSYSGSRSVKISVPGTTDSKSGYPKSDLIEVESLQNYILSVWFKTQGAGGTNAPAIRVVELDANKKVLKNIGFNFKKGTNDWTQKQITFRTGINTRWVYVYANTWDGYGTLWIDDVELRRSNLIANPGFESGATKPLNWSFVTVDGNTPLWSTVSYSGSRSVKISIPGTTDSKSGYPKSDLIEVESLQNYILSVWFKTQGVGGTNAPAIRVVELDANKKSLKNIGFNFKKGTNDWTQKQITFKTGTNTRWIYVYANTWDGYGTLWVDDVELRPYSYIIYTDGINTYAKNGYTGKIDYSGTDSTIIIQNALDMVDNNPTLGKKQYYVYLKGKFTVTGINVKSNTVLDLREAIIISSGNTIPLRLSGTSNSKIIGGVIDCNSQTDGNTNMRCISLLNTDKVTIDGTEVKNGGYYGINLWQANNNIIKNVYSHHNFVGGIHLGSDTAGRGWYNTVQNSIFKNNRISGLSDRGSTVPNEKLYNTYNSITAINNNATSDSRGIFLSGTGSTDAVFTLNDITVLNNTHGLLAENASVYITNLNASYNKESGLFMRAVRNSTIINVTANDNGKKAYSGGIRIIDLFGRASQDITVIGTEARRNWRNIYVFSNVGSKNITFDSIDATDGVDSNVFIYGVQ